VPWPAARACRNCAARCTPRTRRPAPPPRVTETAGSGPYRFRADEFRTGSLVAYERNADYVSVTAGSPSLTAGPKRVWFDRVEWWIIPDPAAAAAAL